VDHCLHLRSFARRFSYLAAIAPIVPAVAADEAKAESGPDVFAAGDIIWMAHTITLFPRHGAKKQ
jgi:hypothetical protein